MQGGSQGSIRSYVWWRETGLLILNISGNRFCANISRQHKSNGIYMVVDMQVATLAALAPCDFLSTGSSRVQGTIDSDCFL